MKKLSIVIPLYNENEPDAAVGARPGLRFSLVSAMTLRGTFLTIGADRRFGLAGCLQGDFFRTTAENPFYSEVV